ncbi:MAG: STAS domain-containing protein [Candidatus Riflebacteria bacterium]|nr:STAS domain-containing protein [Candidatus Riflebacteria bacterium]
MKETESNVQWDGTKVTVIIDGALTAKTVAPLRATLESVLSKNPTEIIFDFATVRKIDSTAIEILIATKKSVPGKGLKISLKGVSEYIRDTFEVLNLNEILKD